jgi:hypothetical protein
MDLISLIIFLAVGAMVGWLAGKIVKGRGFGSIPISGHLSYYLLVKYLKPQNLGAIYKPPMLLRN